MRLPFSKNRKPYAVIAPEAAARELAGGRLVVVDVRELTERLEARPEGTLHLPLGDLPGRIAEVPETK